MLGLIKALGATATTPLALALDLVKLPETALSGRRPFENTEKTISIIVESMDPEQRRDDQ